MTNCFSVILNAFYDEWLDKRSDEYTSTNFEWLKGLDMGGDPCVSQSCFPMVVTTSWEYFDRTEQSRVFRTLWERWQWWNSAHGSSQTSRINPMDSRGMYLTTKSAKATRHYSSPFSTWTFSIRFLEEREIERKKIIPGRPLNVLRCSNWPLSIGLQLANFRAETPQ